MLKTSYLYGYSNSNSKHLKVLGPIKTAILSNLKCLQFWFESTVQGVNITSTVLD